MEDDLVDTRSVAMDNRAGCIDGQDASLIKMAVLELVASEVERKELPLMALDLLEELTVEVLVGPFARSVAQRQLVVRDVAANEQLL